MYSALTFRELLVLQRMLYEGTEEAYLVANLLGPDPDWFGYYRPVHWELVHVFIEVGKELLCRIEKKDLLRAAA